MRFVHDHCDRTHLGSEIIIAGYVSPCPHKLLLLDIGLIVADILLVSADSNRKTSHRQGLEIARGSSA